MLAPAPGAVPGIPARSHSAGAGPARTVVSVFVSYAREDDAFVAALSEALRLNGIEVRSDQDLTPGEDYVLRLRAMIRDSDAFLYCLSTQAVLSNACRAEVETASECGKPILPVVCGELPSDDLVPAPARSPQWFFMRGNDDFVGRVRELVDAIHTDFEMLPQHRSLLQAAEGWEERGRQRADLLRGKNLKAAQEWLRVAGQKPDMLPRPTHLQVEYISASERGASRRMRLWTGASAALVIGVGAIAVVAWQQRSQALLQRDWRSATFAQTMMAEDPTAAMRALADIPEASVVWHQARLIAADALSRGVSEVCVGGVGEINRITVSPGGRLVAALSDSLLVVVGLPECRIVRKVVPPSRPLEAEFIDDERLVTTHADGALRLWSGASWRTAVPFAPIRPRDPRDGDRFRTALAVSHAAGLAAWGREDQGMIRLLDAASRTVKTVETRVGQVWGLRFSPSASYLAIRGPNSVEVLNVRAPQQRWIARFGRSLNDVAFLDESPRLVVATFLFDLTGSQSVGLSIGPMVDSQNFATLFEWNPATGRTEPREQGACESPDALAVAQPSQALFAVRDENQELCAWRSGYVDVVRAKMPEFDTGVSFVGMPRRFAISDDHSLIAVPSSNEDRTIRLWRPATREAYALASPDARATDAVFLPSSRMLLSGHEDGTLRVWDADAVFPRHVDVPADVGRVGNVYTSRRPLAIVGGTRFIVYRSVSDLVPGISRSSKGSSGVDPANINLVVFEPATGRVAGLRGHTAAITDAKTTPDTAGVLTSSMDSTVRSWNIRTHASELVLRDTAGVVALAVSRDGTRVVTVNALGQLRGWNQANRRATASAAPKAREVVRHLPQCRDRAPLVAPGFTDTQFVIGCDGWLFVWDAEAAVTGIDSVRTPFPAIEQLATNRAMRRVAVSHDREVAVIDLSNGDVRTAIAHLSNVQVLAFAESGGDLVSAGVDGIWLWAEDLVHRRRLVGPHIGYPSLAAVGGPGSVVTVAGEHGINTWSDSLPSDGPSLCRLAGRFRRH